MVEHNSYRVKLTLLNGFMTELEYKLWHYINFPSGYPIHRIYPIRSIAWLFYGKGIPPELLADEVYFFKGRQ